MGRLTVGHLNESKAFAAAGVAVHHDTDGGYHSIRLKELAEVLRGSSDCQIAHIDMHGEFPRGNGMNNRQVI
jgi:hypothetical protein